MIISPKAICIKGKVIMLATNKIIKRTFAFIAMCALLGALAGCNVQSAGMSTDEHAVENRQYMALLNTKTGELDEVLTQFQTAIAAGDTVGMKAAATEASKIVDSISNSEPTESLVEVKDAYVAGLTDINTAMNDYADLYTQVSAGTLDQSGFDRKLKIVQASYDQAVGKLTAADDLLTQLANE